MDQQVDLDVDNLFNDTGSLNQDSLDHILPAADHAVLQTQSVPLAPGLADRILDLTYSGCQTRVAWSRQGHVAKINEDGSTVTLQCLRADPVSSRWKLTNPKPLSTTFEGATTLLWSPTGFDLAVVDIRGRISLLSLNTTGLNLLDEKKPGDIDEPDELGQPIGALWFNQDRQEKARPVVVNFTKHGSNWSQTMGRGRPLGPLYPRAFCMVNRQGDFILTYQRPDAVHRRTSTRLPVPLATLFSHAAISPTLEGRLLLALYSVDGVLSVYYVQVVWPVEWRTNHSDVSHPAINIEVVDNHVPIASVGPNSVENSIDQTYNPDSWTLTHLEIVPTSDIENSMQLPPTIWAAYASVNQTSTVSDAGFAQSSIIRRWSVSAIEQKLHPMFDQIISKTDNSLSLQNTIVVERLSDTLFPQLITAIELINDGQAIGISTADGRTELWNATTMSPASFDAQPNEVTSMTQAGFTFPPASSAVLTALSANACMSIAVDYEGKISMNQAQYLGQNSHEVDLEDSQQSAAIASLVLTFSRACWSNVNMDDLITSTTTSYQSPQLVTIAAAFYRFICRETEFIHEKAPGSEAEKIVTNNPMIGKVLSINLALLSAASSQIPQQEGTVPNVVWARLWNWICINARYVTTHLYFFYREVQSGTVLPDSYIDMICNVIKWCFDLYRFIVESVLEVGDRATTPDLFDPPSALNNLGDEKGNGSQGLVALLINCQWSRSLLTAPGKALRAFVEKHVPGAGPMDKVVNAIHQYSHKKGLSLTAVESLLDGRWYTRNGLGENETHDNSLVASRQIEMMTTGYVSTHYQSTIQNLLAKVINSDDGLRARGEISRLKLFTDAPDVDWILLNMDEHIPSLSNSIAMVKVRNKANEKVYYDAHKKSAIRVRGGAERNQLVRRCVRCGSLSEDTSGAIREWPKKLVTYMARCVCDGYWVLEPLESEGVGK